jgi:predicted kinase
MFDFGTKVITIAQGDGFRVGTVIGYSCTNKDFNTAKNPIPMVKYSNEELVHFGLIAEYSDDIVHRLESLDSNQQWELLTVLRNENSDKTLFIMRGLQGSGKSTLAKALASSQGQVFASDDYFMIEGEYNWDASKIKDAHEWNYRRIECALNNNIPIVVVDNTNITLWELNNLREIVLLAGTNGYNVKIMTPNTSWAFDVDELFKRNTHNVPREVIERKHRDWHCNATIEDILFKHELSWEKK